MLSRYGSVVHLHVDGWRWLLVLNSVALTTYGVRRMMHSAQLCPLN